MLDGAFDRAFVLDVPALVTAGRCEDQWCRAYGRMRAARRLSGAIRGRVPDAVQRFSRCTAEPGPIGNPREHGPRISSAPRQERRAAQHPGHANTHLRILAARCARVVLERSAQQRAWGMPGARCTRSLVRKVESTRVSHHGRTGTPGIPARNGFNGFLRAIPGDRALLSPSPVKPVHRLNTNH